MDECILAEQYAQSGDLMDLCKNEAWLRESGEIENGVQVEAGLASQEYSQGVAALTGEQNQKLRQQMKVQTIVLSAMRQWMETWDLGAGFEETYAKSRQLIRHHLANPTTTQQGMMEKLLALDVKPGKINTSSRKQAMDLLSEMFTQSDWQAMAEAASHCIASQVLRAGKIPHGVTRGKKGSVVVG